jgi:uncharacterized protein YggE
MEEKKQIGMSSGAPGAVVIFFILLFVFAKWGPAINFSTTAQSVGQPFVVSGEGKVTVTPDIAKINLGIQENGLSLKQVQDSVNTKSKTLTSKLKSLGINENDIKTTSYYVYPQYDYSSSSRKVTGYQVSTNYLVTINNFETINNVLVAATEVGANDIGGISFDLNESTKVKKTNEARELAVKNAQAKADGLAKAAGIGLGRVINVSENSDFGIVRNMALPVASGMGFESKSAAQPDVQPGTSEINLTVSLSYEVR